MKTVTIQTVYWGIEFTKTLQVHPKDLDELMKNTRALHVQHLLERSDVRKELKECMPGSVAREKKIYKDIKWHALDDTLKIEIR